MSVASSADGGKLVAVTFGGQIYTAGEGYTGSSTAGTGGYLTASRGASLELLYTGSGQFFITSQQGTIFPY